MMKDINTLNMKNMRCDKMFDIRKVADGMFEIFYTEDGETYRIITKETINNLSNDIIKNVELYGVEDGWCQLIDDLDRHAFPFYSCVGLYDCESIQSSGFEDWLAQLYYELYTVSLNNFSYKDLIK